MKCYEKRINCKGILKEVIRYRSIRSIRKEIRRRGNREKSSAWQKEYNRFQKKRKIQRLLICNFVPGEIYATLTVPQGVGREDADKLFKKFLRRLRDDIRKSDKDTQKKKSRRKRELKWLGVKEYRYGTKVHFHVVINEKNREYIEKMWEEISGGHANTQKLYADGYFLGLAEYLAKESDKGGNYRCSRNLDAPKVEVREIKEEKIAHKIPVPRGWMLDKSADEVDTGLYHYVRLMNIRKVVGGW